MIRIGTPGTPLETRILLLGAGELGKEVAIEAQRLGATVIAADRYPGAPAMQVAHRSHVLPLGDAVALRALVKEEAPHFVVPEIEAIATDVLLELEAAGTTVIPTARAAHLTMNREGIRRLAAEELDLPTSPFRFAESYEELAAGAESVGYPCIVKPIMSSSGKGQSMVRAAEELEAAWSAAQAGARGKGDKVIVEGFVDFEFEITLLTVRHAGGALFCEPIGHRQVGGDYHESWQPQPMTKLARERAEAMATKVTDALGGRGVFGVELFVRGDEVWFSEVSPRPHDTGLVTLVSQSLSEFALHVRAILGFELGALEQLGPAASAVILGTGESDSPEYRVHPAALQDPGTELRLFGKPTVQGERRLGVAVAKGDSLDQARKRARNAAGQVSIKL